MSSQRGFTIVEILVAVAIIGALTAIGTATYQSANQKARDARRKADLEQIRAALEMYKADNGEYPCGYLWGPCKGTSGSFGYSGRGQGWATSKEDGSSCYSADLENILEGGSLSKIIYMPQVPHDPYGGGCNGYKGGKYWGYMYYYATAGGKDYCLYARLDKPPADNGCSGCPTAPLTSYDKNYCLKNP